jgi:general secretion pathway protein L
LSVCIERGKVSIVLGGRIFSRIRIKGAKFFPCTQQNDYPTPDFVAESAKTAARAFHAPTRDVTLVVPKSWTTAKVAQLPATAKINLPKVVAFELDRLTPLTADEALYDFVTLEETGERLSLFLAVCRSDVVMPYVKALADKGITAGRVATRASAMASCCSYLLRTPAVVFAEMRPGGYEGGFLIGRKLAASFSGTFDGEGFDERAGRVKIGMERAAAPYRNGGDVTTAITIRDGGIGEASAKDAFAAATVLTDVERKRLHMKTALPMLDLAESGAIVQSLWPKAEGLDLLARGYRKKAKSPIGLTVLLLVAIVALAVVQAVMPINIEQGKLNEIERQIKALKPAVRQVEALKKDIDVQEKENAAIADFKKGRPLTINLMREITKILPKTAWLTRARITDTAVDLEGYAGSAAEILPKLEASPFLKKVEFASPTFRDTRLNADRFVIKMEVENGKKADSGGSKGGIKE